MATDRVSETYAEVVVSQQTVITKRVAETYAEVIVADQTIPKIRAAETYVEVIISSKPRQGWGALISAWAAVATLPALSYAYHQLINAMSNRAVANAKPRQLALSDPNR